MSQPGLSALLARLEALEAEAAIRGRILDIARGLDRFDAALLRGAIWPDAVLDFGGAETVSGDRFAEALRPPAEARPGRMHLVGNMRIRVSGTVAQCESYVVSIQDVAAGEGSLTRTRAVRWVDRFDQRAGDWKLSRRILVDEWGRSDPVRERPQPGRYLGLPVPADVSYQP